MDKKLKIILCIIIILLLIGGIYLLYSKNSSNANNDITTTGVFNKITTYKGQYILTIESTEAGHPGEGLFDTGTNINYNNKTAYFSIIYVDIYEHGAKSDYKNISSMKTKKINGKKFRYFINDNENSINLIYQKNASCYLLIKIISNGTFDSSGNSIDDDKISSSILDDDKIKGTMHFKIQRNKAA